MTDAENVKPDPEVDPVTPYEAQLDEAGLCLREAYELQTKVRRKLRRAQRMMPESDGVREAITFAGITRLLIKSIGHDGRIEE